MVLTLSIIGGASIGVVSNFMTMKSSFGKNAWRYGITCLYFLIPALIENYQQWKTIKYKEIFTLKKYLDLITTLLMQSLWAFGLIYASSRTIQTQAYVLNNAQGIFVILIGYYLGQKIYSGEWSGLFFGVTGCMFIMLDPDSTRTDVATHSGPALIPEVIDFASAFFGAIYFIMNARNVQSLPIMSLLFFMNFHLFFINAVCAKYLTLSDNIEIFSFDKYTGCLGFFDPEIAFTAFVPYGILCGVMGSAGITLTLLFYPPIVVTNSYLL